MEIETKDYTGKPLGTARKWIRWLIQFPFGLALFLTLLPAVALGIGVILATILGVLEVIAIGIIAVAMVVVIPATLFLLSLGLGPFEVKDDDGGESEGKDVGMDFEVNVD